MTFARWPSNGVPAVAGLSVERELTSFRVVHGGRLRGVVRRIGSAPAADSCHRGISRASSEPGSWVPESQLRPVTDAI